MEPQLASPIVTVGVPVYNSEKTIGQVLESIINQTYANIQIVISDNCSTDSTASICREFLESDHRITLYEQSENIGAVRNFEFVLNHATGEYFLWSAADDVRSLNFIEVNLQFLLNEPTYAASTSPHIHSDQLKKQENIVKFSLEGTRVDRFAKFFRTPGASHGIFYSLMRTELIKSCPFVKTQTFWGWDWAIILYLLTYGPIHRTKEGFAIFGAEGMSRSNEVKNLMGIKGVRRYIPFMDFNRQISKLIKDWKFFEKSYVLLLIVGLNLKTLAQSNKFTLLLFYYLKKFLYSPQRIINARQK